MVISYKLLPEHIQDIKPKSAPRRPRTRRKQSDEDAKLICVKFFADDEYIWVSTLDAKPLTYEAIDDYLVKKGEIPDDKGNIVGKKSTKTNKLTNAYLLARNRDLTEEAFAKYGSLGEPEPERVGEEDSDYEEYAEGDDEEEDEEEEEDDEEEDEEEEDDLESGTDEEAESEAEEEDELVEFDAEDEGSRKRPRGRSSKGSSRSKRIKSNGKSKSRAKSRPKARKVDPAINDAEWGADPVDNEEVEGIVDLDTFPDAGDLWDEAEETNEQYRSLRETIQAVVLGELDADEETHPSYKRKTSQLAPLIDQVIKYKEPTVAALRGTNLYKILVVILKKPEYQSAPFKKKLRKFLIDTMGLEVEEDPHWGDGYESEEEEKETEDTIKEEPEKEAETEAATN